MICTPAETRSSAARCAPSAGTASTPTTTLWARTSSASRSYGSTETRPIGCPSFDSSVSTTTAMLIPCSAKIEDEAIAWPRRPAPTSATLCWPWVRRIFRIASSRSSIEYPTPRLPNLPKFERSRRICVALMFVYSAISCEEILVLPIFRACVSTWRYRDRRAATPTFKRSATRPPFYWLYFVTALSVVPACLRLRLCNRTTERIRMDEVGKAPPSVDLHDRDPLAIFRFELWVAVDRDLPQLEAELIVRSR